MNENKDVLMIVGIAGLLLLIVAMVFYMRPSQQNVVTNSQAVAAVRGSEGPTQPTASAVSNAGVADAEVMRSSMEAARKAVKIQQASDQKTMGALKGSRGADE